MGHAGSVHKSHIYHCDSATVTRKVLKALMNYKSLQNKKYDIKTLKKHTIIIRYLQSEFRNDAKYNQIFTQIKQMVHVLGFRKKFITLKITSVPILQLVDFEH